MSYVAVRDLLERITEKEARIAKLEAALANVPAKDEALRFYAGHVEAAFWDPPHQGSCAELLDDQGARARAALGGVK